MEKKREGAFKDIPVLMSFNIFTKGFLHHLPSIFFPGGLLAQSVLNNLPTDF